MSSEIDKRLPVTEQVSESLNKQNQETNEGGTLILTSEKLKCDDDTFEAEPSNIQNTNLIIFDINQVTPKNSRRNMIIHYGKEVMCILALILTTYATLNKGTPKFERTPLPKLLFTNEYLVRDWPEGELSALQNKVSSSELSMVLFYAPWCAQSSSVKYPYEFVARMYYREVFFAAINCWQPGGECRFQHSKIQSWPIIMAYYPQRPAVQYNGIWTEQALSRFVYSLLHPIERVTHSWQLTNILIDSDAVIVGFFDIIHLKAIFNKFFEAAVTWLEQDPFQEIKFVAVTGESIKEFNVTSTPSIRMYLWNETIDFPLDKKWSSENINNWIIKKLSYISSWINPTEHKTDVLSIYLRKHPTLLMFTPRDYYTDNKDGYHLIKQIALQYFSCQNYSSIKYVSTNLIISQREDYRRKWTELKEKCSNIMPNINDTPKYCKKKCYNNKTENDQLTGILNNSKFNERFENEELYCFINDNESKKIFGQSLLNHDKNVPFDDRNPINLRETAMYNLCKRLRLANYKYEEIFFSMENKNDRGAFEGISCKFNRTLSFLMLDSVYYNTYLKSLDLNKNKMVENSTIVIVDSENDSIYQLNKKISESSIAGFIKDFHSGNLDRKLRVKRRSELQKLSKNQFLIKEIDSDEFDRYIERKSSTKVVLFYSTHCALCNIVSQTLLTLAVILKNVNIEFVRIDAEKNDLLWQYTMEMYPTLIIFPRNKQSETRVFPSSMEPNLSNLLGFIMANLNPIDRLHSTIEACKYLKNCLQILREDISNMISLNLKLWRHIPSSRAEVFRQLQVLRRIYLLSFRMNDSGSIKNLKKEVIFLNKISQP